MGQRQDWNRNKRICQNINTSRWRTRNNSKQCLWWWQLVLRGEIYDIRVLLAVYYQSLSKPKYHSRITIRHFCHIANPYWETTPAPAHYQYHSAKVCDRSKEREVSLVFSGENTFKKVSAPKRIFKMKLINCNVLFSHHFSLANVHWTWCSCQI